MTRPRSLAAGLLLALVALLVLPTAALALTTPADVANALRSDRVYVDPQVGRGAVDADTLRSAIRDSGRPVYVAVLPAAAGSSSGGAVGVTNAIGRALGDPAAVLFTATGTTLAGAAGGQSPLGPGQAERIASSHSGTDLTAALRASIRDVASTGRGGSSGSGTTTQPAADRGGSGGGGLVLLLLVLLLLAGAAYLLLRRRRRQTGRSGTGGDTDLPGARADVESLYGRLGQDVSTLRAGDDPVAQQALADAAERYNATGAQLSSARTAGEYAAARRTVVEGLTAARVARQRLGLDPGPDVPPPPGEGPQLQAAERVRVGDQDYDGSPVYTPGRQHYWGGGYVGGSMVPGGWYGVPFWETMLIGSALSGGLGGYGYGGGYGGYGGGGFERGYEEGVEDAREARSDDGGYGDQGGSWGGDWGSSGGGDWGGGGGGDWGGGGGGDGGW